MVGPLRRKKTVRTLRAFLGAALLAPGLFVGNAFGVTQTADQRLALALVSLGCDDADDASYASEFPGVTLEPRQALARGEQVFGWRQTLQLPNHQRAVLERIAPQGHLRRISVEIRDSESKPRLLVLADQDCSLREARAIRYQDGRAKSLLLLDGEFQPRADPVPMNPPFPVGKDSGQVAVALVDSGVNYLLSDIAQHLARDAQGTPLGFDYWDMDTRPFDAHPVRSEFFPQRHGTRVAGIIAREAPQARLIPYRYPRPDMERMSKLIVKAAASGARIINMSLGSSDELEWAAFEEAVLKHPELLFVVSAGNDGRDIDQDPVFPAALPLDNMIVVTSVADDGFPAQGSNWGRDSVDLLVPGENIATVDFSGRPADVSGSSYAVARVTALAARLLAEQPTLSASALRDQIFALADAEPGNFVRVGWIREPSDLARAADVRSIRLTAQASSAAVPLKNGLDWGCKNFF